ncbi:hypothetical protein Y032_0365g3575 [Ancylostoma ceylanicum]|uniref:Uncharacterized protein n=1 Tax=Ancylostoma ceylanicum TaxID=53326 RepID=A0A016RVZ9_9BILA|nr:hypothetical protein Y032_0365g3575 [Ancylostoma ceylanicum]
MFSDNRALQNGPSLADECPEVNFGTTSAFEKNSPGLCRLDAPGSGSQWARGLVTITCEAGISGLVVPA